MVKCEISCEFFGGFTTEVDLNYMDSKKDICEQVKRTLITTLQINNLPALAYKAEKINFHIHDFDFGDILMMDFKEKKLWICNHTPHCNDENKKDEENTNNTVLSEN